MQSSSLVGPVTVTSGLVRTVTLVVPTADSTQPTSPPVAVTSTRKFAGQPPLMASGLVQVMVTEEPDGTAGIDGRRQEGTLT